MTANVIVRNGMVQTNNLQALLDIANVGITGNANLVTQALNLDVTAILSRGFSQQIGGTGIAGYMNTALANTQGELVIPATVTGTFQHPVFGPNVQKIAQMKLKGLMPSADNPLGGASGILGNLLGQKNVTPNQGQQPNTQQQPKSCRPDPRHYWQEEKATHGSATTEEIEHRSLWNLRHGREPGSAEK